jgi:four helix bundle protein
VRLARQLFATIDGQVIGRQLVKAGTGVAANYRAACRARSGPDFVAKMGIVEEEADEADFWLRLIGDLDLTKDPVRQELQNEASELVAIAAA